LGILFAKIETYQQQGFFMSSNAISPNYDQAALQSFNDSFFELAQQTQSMLESSPAVIHLASKGKTSNFARIGRLELVETNTRNPDKIFSDYAVDNRQLTKRRFTRTVQIDAKYDINELLKDPTSDILKQLVNAKARVIDRVIVSSAIGAVLTGAPDAAPTSTSAATDGVITVDASAGLTYEKIQEITQNFINNELQYSMFKGSVLAISGKENTALMGETEFISSDFISGRPVEAGVQMNAGCYSIVMFAGSVNGGITVTNPILPEGTTLRDCVVLAPDSVAISMELNLLDVQRSATKVNSYDITIDLWLNGMRTEGVRVQKVQTTI
jgi:hypothetical protein